MRQLRDNARLAPESFTPAMQRRDVRTQHLDRDESLERAITREIHRAHTAAAERAQNLILLVERALEGRVYLRLECAPVPAHAQCCRRRIRDRDARLRKAVVIVVARDREKG